MPGPESVVRLGRLVCLIALGMGLGVLVLGTSGCSKTSHGHTGGDREVAPQAPPQDQGQKFTNVRVQVMTRADVQETFTLPGTLAAWEDITLSLEQSGPIRWIGPKEGDRIDKGDPILRIDPETLKAQLEADQVDFDLSRRHLERVEKLLEKDFSSEQELDQAWEAFEVARSTLIRSRLALAKSTLVSPVAGVLDELLVDRGEYGSVGTPAAVVVRVDQLKVLVDVPEKDVPSLQVGMPARVSLASLNRRAPASIPGKIVHVAYRADPSTRTYRAKVAVQNASRTLRPGMIVRVEFDRQLHRQVVTVPLYSLLDQDGQKELYVAENGMARRRPVKIGPVVDGKVVIYEGVEAGEHVIISGQQLVRDGAPVRVVEG